MKTPQKHAVSAGAVVHKEQDKRAKMNDLCDSGKVINSELALPPSLTSNAVQKTSLTSIFLPAET